MPAIDILAVDVSVSVVVLAIVADFGFFGREIFDVFFEKIAMIIDDRHSCILRTVLIAEAVNAGDVFSAVARNKGRAAGIAAADVRLFIEEIHEAPGHLVTIDELIAVVRADTTILRAICVDRPGRLVFDARGIIIIGIGQTKSDRCSHDFTAIEFLGTRRKRRRQNQCRPYKILRNAFFKFNDCDIIRNIAVVARRAGKIGIPVDILGIDLKHLYILVFGIPESDFHVLAVV